MHVLMVWALNRKEVGAYTCLWGAALLLCPAPTDLSSWQESFSILSSFLDIAALSSSYWLSSELPSAQVATCTLDTRRSDSSPYECNIHSSPWKCQCCIFIQDYIHTVHTYICVIGVGQYTMARLGQLIHRPCGGGALSHQCGGGALTHQCGGGALTHFIQKGVGNYQAK